MFSTETLKTESADGRNFTLVQQEAEVFATQQIYILGVSDTRAQVTAQQTTVKPATSLPNE